MFLVVPSRPPLLYVDLEEETPLKYTHLKPEQQAEQYQNWSESQRRNQTADSHYVEVDALHTIDGDDESEK